MCGLPLPPSPPRDPVTPSFLLVICSWDPPRVCVSTLIPNPLNPKAWDVPALGFPFPVSGVLGLGCFLPGVGIAHH